MSRVFPAVGGASGSLMSSRGARQGGGKPWAVGVPVCGAVCGALRGAVCGVLRCAAVRGGARQSAVCGV
jgi:hypothetical protein